MRLPARRTKRPDAIPDRFPAPVRGWIRNESLAATTRGGARLIENWVPTQSGVRLRKGSFKVATVPAAVHSLFSYESAAVAKVFASTGTAVYDVTSVADPDVPPSAEFSGQTGGYYSTAMIGTAGGDFLYAVNGVNKPRLYDGSTWTAIDGASTPAITGVTTSDLSQVWLFKSRLFFVEANSRSAWYLPVDSIGGAASEFSLSAVFQRGGVLLFGATWSSDSGDGMDDRCVFVSTNGECAVYEGTDPSSAATWRLVGRYDIPKPMGRNGFLRVGGDLLILTVEGVIPVSQVVAKDPAALSLAAVSYAIEDEWSRQAQLRTALPWEMAKWDEGNLGIVSLPTEDPDTVADARCFVVNLETGAWATFTGWDTRCLAVAGGRVYFGTNAGAVMQAERGGSDNGEMYECRMSLQPSDMGRGGGVKAARQMRGIFIATTNFVPKYSVSTNYRIAFPAAPGAAMDGGSAVWDTGLWDVAIWDGASPQLTNVQWQSVAGVGVALAPQVQVSQSGAVEPDVELISLEITYEAGDIVV